MTTTTAAPVKAEKTRQTTAYHVFKKTGNDATYQLVGPNIAAANANAAIRAHLKKTGETAGRYVATPARSFTEVEVKVETVTTVKLA